MTLLVLGGTSDGRILAEALHNKFQQNSHKSLSLIYSVAGVARLPQMSCRVVSGGFSQHGGLEVFIAENNITAILDATHPYAQTISERARVAAKACDIPYWRFDRKPWQPEADDQWYAVDNWDQALPLLADKSSVMVTIGQLNETLIEKLVNLDTKISSTKHSSTKPRQYIVRTAVAPIVSLPSVMEWIQGVGPFTDESEQALMEKYQIDMVLSKNSGGDAVAAKLRVARQRKIPVVMLNRPDTLIQLPEEQLFTDYLSCIDYIAGVYYGL